MYFSRLNTKHSRYPASELRIALSYVSELNLSSEVLEPRSDKNKKSEAVTSTNIYAVLMEYSGPNIKLKFQVC